MPKPQPEIVGTLNARFRDGHPDSDLNSVGVILRQFDATEDQQKPWRGCPAQTPWTPEMGGECHIYGKRFSASIVNAQLSRRSKRIQLFSRIDAGVVYSPRIRLNCVYGGDGGTRKFPDDGCGTEFCTQSKTDGWCDGKPHKTKDVGAMLARLPGSGYNEVVINTQSIDEQLPRAVEAIFYLRGSAISARRARETHRHFLELYDLPATDHPLLRLDPNNIESPFAADEPRMV